MVVGHLLYLCWALADCCMQAEGLLAFAAPQLGMATCCTMLELLYSSGSPFQRVLSRGGKLLAGEQAQLAVGCGIQWVGLAAIRLRPVAHH